jgi:Ca-activated chloride channel family protein
MRLPRPIQNSLPPLLLVFAAQKVCAQLAPADDFFNSGAQFYISNNIPAALEKTEAGLKIYPDDEKLKKLEELLKQQQQSQQNQQQQNQQSQSQQQKQDQQKNQQQQNQQQNSQSEQKPDEQKQDQSGQKKEDQQKQSEEKQNGEIQTNAPGQMTPEEAKKLLDAQKGDEQLLQFKPQGKPQDNQKPVKDW